MFIIAHAIWFGAGGSSSTCAAITLSIRIRSGCWCSVVSLEAIFLSAAVLMTQNRMQRQADKRAHLDLQVNLLAEQELTAILKMVTGLCARLGVQAAPTDAGVSQLLKDTDIHTIASAIDRELESTAPSSAPEPHTLSPRRS